MPSGVVLGLQGIASGREASMPCRWEDLSISSVFQSQPDSPTKARWSVLSNEINQGSSNGDYLER